MSATDTTFPILSILGVSVIYVKRFQRRCSGQPAPHSIVPKEGWTTTILLLYKFIHIFMISRYPGTKTVSVKVLHLLLLHSRDSCLCPDITSTKNIPRKHDRLSKISTLHSSRTALENIRILELNHLFSSGCEADSFEILLL